MGASGIAIPKAFLGGGGGGFSIFAGKMWEIF